MHVGPSRPLAHQSSQTVHFHYQQDALGAVPSPRSSRSLSDLPNCSFSSQKRCPGSHVYPKIAQQPARAPQLPISIARTLPWEPVQCHSMPKVTPKPAEAPKLFIFIAKTMPWGPFPARGRLKARQSYQTIHFIAETMPSEPLPAQGRPEARQGAPPAKVSTIFLE